MEVLSSRILIRPVDPGRSRRFYRDTLGLAIYREFGPPDDPGLVFFLGQSLLEVSGRADRPAHTAALGDATGAGGSGEPAGAGAGQVRLWLQVRDLVAEHRRLAAAGVPIVRAPQREPWGLDEMWIEDPDGIPIVVVEIPPEHPLRRDQR
ncbi:VOC family protein [Frankia sp. QA3]|uniref:VOC family protein n=1 Tax=Frankia sp. QA3 TaxID=710111 RepID=UPI000269BCCE|nr:VOC family protein [Frankia sp. QA3]EIV92251.1 lactoylglutathione lyase-like lyase [Frankia sp. QA3]